MIKQKEPPMMLFRALNLETDSILVFFLSSNCCDQKKNILKGWFIWFIRRVTVNKNHIPSWKLTYPIFKKGTFESMIFRTSPGGICFASLVGTFYKSHTFPVLTRSTWVETDLPSPHTPRTGVKWQCWVWLQIRGTYSRNWGAQIWGMMCSHLFVYRNICKHQCLWW